MRYFIGNWKMFGIPKSINILNKINFFYSKDKNRKKYRVIITPPYTLIESYARFFKNKKSLLVRKIAIKKISFHQIQLLSPFYAQMCGSQIL